MQEEKVQTPEAEGAQKSPEEQLAEAHAKIEQQRDAMMRVVAESDNARKRAQAESASAQKYAVERFAESLLPVMDSLEAALANTKDAPPALREGVELTLRLLRTTFQKANLGEIDPKPGEILLAPACGTGGFLTCAIRQALDTFSTAIAQKKVIYSGRNVVVRRNRLPHENPPSQNIEPPA